MPDGLTKWLKGGRMKSERPDQEIELTKIYLMRKSPAWRYEKEARIIRPRHGLLRIPGDFLEQVCFGLRTPDTDIHLVTTLAKAYCGCTNFCQMVLNETDYGFTMEPI